MFSSNFNINGLPVGISSLEISFSSNLNKYLHNDLIEFPCAATKIFLFNLFSRLFLKYGITLSYVSLSDSVSGILFFGYVFIFQYLLDDKGYF